MEKKNGHITSYSYDDFKTYIGKMEIGYISAQRESLMDITESTFVDREMGFKFTIKDNKIRNNDLKATLLKMGYGVFACKHIDNKKFNGIHKTAFYVFNLNEDKEFFENLFMLSEFYNQDYFIYKALDDPLLSVKVGTNNSENPGYRKKRFGHNLYEDIKGISLGHLSNEYNIKKNVIPGTSFYMLSKTDLIKGLKIQDMKSLKDSKKWVTLNISTNPLNGEHPFREFSLRLADDLPF